MPDPNQAAPKMKWSGACHQGEPGGWRWGETFIQKRQKESKESIDWL